MAMSTVKPTLVEALRAGAVLADGGIGSLIFQLTGRLASQEFVYEALNLQNPGLIKGIYSSSLAAGATVLTTNTFAANVAELTAAGIGDQVEQINSAAVGIAREAIKEHVAEYSIENESFYVIASIGPGGSELNNYSSQLDALINSGVDALLLETFTDIELLLALTNEISSRPGAPPVIAHGALDLGVGESRSWPVEPVEFISRASKAGAKVAGINCVAPWVATEFINAAKLAPEVADASAPVERFRCFIDRRML
jgi:homocysteine S-methyltransferase